VTFLNVIYLSLLVLALFTFLLIVVLILTYLERKTLGRIQMRMGPMRVGFHGILQPLADGLKLLVKEDILPAWADKKIFWLAPIVVFIPSFMIWVTIPLAEDLVLQNLDLGLFYIVALSVLSVIGLVMAGWSSGNKYATFGGLRAVAQLISYEIPLIMAILGVAMLVQSLKLTDIVDGNFVTVTIDGHRTIRNLAGQHILPFAAIQPLGLFIFFVSGLAEIGRTPFDIHHAESEIVGGPLVEYSGIHWAIFFLAEYMNTFTISILTVLLFFGGWSWPEMPTTFLSVLWFLIKTLVVVMIIFWIRGTYPRLRIDQLMSFAWKLLVPLSFINIIITGIFLFYGWPFWSLTIMSLPFLLGAFYIIYKKSSSYTKHNTVQVYPAKWATQK